MKTLMKTHYPDEIELDIPGGEVAIESLPEGERGKSPSRAADRVRAALVTVAPPAGFALALWLHWIGWYQIGWVEIGSLLLMWTLAVAGIELGFHRLFSHGAYTAVPGLRIALAIMGSFAFQGPVIWWVAMHRKHHRHSDRPGDPHSMYWFADGKKVPDTLWGRMRGFFHGHLGWIWTRDSIRSPAWDRYVPDLNGDEAIVRIHKSYLILLALGVLLPALIGGLAHASWKGAFLGFLWGGLVRFFLMNHMTYWTINTISHVVGPRPYQTADHSTNSIPLLFAVPTLGQSYHNNHHAFPASSKMSHRWYEFDVGHGLLWLFERCGWVADRRYPSPAQMADKASTPRAAALHAGD